MNKQVKLFLPHIVAIITFLLVSYIYFFPAIEGKTLNGTDNITAKAQQGEIGPYTALTGDYCAWTNAAFGGMPAYTIWVKKNAPLRIISNVINFFTFGSPINYLFIALLAFYILLIINDVSPWLSIAGSFAYAFSTYYIVIIGAGHITKVLGLAYMPGVIAGILLVYKKRKVLLGAAVMALFLALEIAPGHYQIIYYTILIAVAVGIFYLISAIKEKTLSRFLGSTGILIVAAILASLTNLSSIWTTQEYTPYSARGNSELTLADNSDRPKSDSGLDFNYAMQWSYGIGESLNLLIPGFRGGSSSAELSTNSEVYKLFSRQNSAQAKQIIKHFPVYWGPQPSTEGPAYMGAVVLFLFLFALFFLKNKEKWWILIISVVALFLAWGGNFEWFNRLMFDYFPLYNKFRAVTTTLIIIQFALPLLGIMAIQKLISGYEKKDFINALKWSAGILGGITLLFAAFPGLAGNFTGPADSTVFGNNQTLLDAVMADRKSLVQSDAFRSLLFIAATVAVLFMFHIKKMNWKLLSVAIAVLVLLDLSFVDRRIVSYENFQTQRVAKSNFTPSVVDKSIYQDEIQNPETKNKVDEFLTKYKNTKTLKENESPDLLALNLTTDFRVLNLSKGINFSDPLTSYYFKSLSGYSPAKLRRYQDLIDHDVLVAQIQNLVKYLQTGQDTGSFGLLNMLNTKYIIANPEQPAIVNRKALGNAWFVQNIQWVDNANLEFESITKIDPVKEAVINNEFKEILTPISSYDSTATIKLTEYKPDALTYHSNSGSDMVAVFSEIYYPKGWKVYIDGKPTDYFRANYLFRAMVVPSGSHTIEFKFEPKSYIIGNKVNAASSILLMIFTLVTICLYCYRSYRNQEKVEV